MSEKQESPAKEPPRWVPLGGQALAERLRRIRELADQLAAELARARSR